jgi:quinolinate synthase
MGQSDLVREIERLREERNAVILAHNYQSADIQDIADYVGDSLGLSRQAAATPAEVIVFCGVHFMAETAAILSPNKLVLLPDAHAGCPMADMITVEELRRLKGEHPDATVVTYVNSSAAVKAESDYCCTSANAVEVCQAVASDEILFVPDKWLGNWVARHVPKRFHFAAGYCPTHVAIRVEDVEKARAAHPDALVIAHPECPRQVVDLADEVLSTSGMLDAVRVTPKRQIIVCTEEGILHRMRKESPEKEFIAVSPRAVCPNMKKTTLEKVLWALQDLEPVVTVDPDIAEKALRAIQRMIEVA